MQQSLPTIVSISDDSFIASSSTTELMGLDSELGNGLQIEDAEPISIDQDLSPPCSVGDAVAASSFLPNAKTTRQSPILSLSSTTEPMGELSGC